jgi:hypothetical protein
MKSIYIQIPAYRDSELAPTLLDLIRNAEHPEALRIAVFWQKSRDEKLPDELRRHPCIELIECPYEQSQGCNWARAELQARWNGEPYTLLLDSHHRFIPSWDRRLIRMYEDLRAAGVAKPLLTAYLPPYDPGNDPAGRSPDPLRIYSHSRERGMLVYLIAHKIPPWEVRESPVPAKFTSLHFVFTAGAFNREIVHDRDIYFFGDEVVLGLRAFTHGYDLYHPHYAIGWHLYNRTLTRTTHWEDHADHSERNQRSCERIRDIFLGVAQETLGPCRTVDDYESMICERLIQC